MKIIHVPAPIKVKYRRQTGEEYEEDLAFSKFVTDSFDAFQLKSVKQVRQSIKVIALAEKANGTLSLEDDDFLALKDATNQVAYFPRVARQIVPFWEALEKVEDQK